MIGYQFAEAYRSRPITSLPLAGLINGVLDDVLIQAPQLAGEVAKVRLNVARAEELAATTPESQVNGVVIRDPRYVSRYETPDKLVEESLMILRWRAHGSPDPATWKG